MFREVLEAVIVIAVLLSLVESIVKKGETETVTTEDPVHADGEEKSVGTASNGESDHISQATLVRKLRIQASAIFNPSCVPDRASEYRSSPVLEQVCSSPWQCECS